MVALVRDAPALGAAADLRGAAELGALERGAHDEGELAGGIVAVLALIAREGRRDDQGAVSREALAEPLDEPAAIVVAEGRRGLRVPAQVDLARDLVDVLAAGSTRARECDRQLTARDRQLRRDDEILDMTPRSSR